MSGLHDKIYYNISINGNPGPNNYYIPAKFSVNLNDSIVLDASKFSLIVQKFKIDSESIPLFHVELLQPQNKIVGNVGFITKYVIYLTNNGNVYSQPLIYNKPFAPPAPIIKQNDDGTVIYDNRHNMFSIYSYSDFLLMINTAINSIATQAGLTDIPFFEYDPFSERIKFFVPEDFTSGLYFSKNLLQFIGEGFSTNYFNINPVGINEKVFSINIRKFTYNQQEYNMVLYDVMTQEHKAISSWACINRVLFVSNNLPITREFFPVNDSGGILVGNGNDPYRKMSNMPIITSFLIDSSNAGDYRTSIIFSTGDVDNSDIITMPTNVDIRNIDIEVHWSDKFGNVYPLVLADGKQIDLRLAFIKK